MADLTQAVAESHVLAPHQDGVRLALRTARPQVPGQPHTVLKPFDLAFDRTDPNAQQWIDEHAAELAKGLSETTRQAIEDALAEWYEGGSRADATDEIFAAVGDEDRADLIAHHESMLAANEGQRQSWDQAVDAGLLTGTEKRTWIATADQVVCLICEELDGRVADLDGEYPDPGGDGPPQHLRCRCTEGISG